MSEYPPRPSTGAHVQVTAPSGTHEAAGTVSQSRARRIRVCIVAPSMRFVGGQAIQAQRLIVHLRALPDFEVEFLPHDPEIPEPLARLQRIKFVRTVVNTVWYIGSLLARLPHADVVHTFSAAYWSYALGPMWAILVARLYGKPVILNYRSGELEDHLQRWPRLAPRTMGWATRIVSPTPYLVDVYRRFGLHADVIPNFLEPDGLAFRSRDPLRPVLLANRNLWPLYNYPAILEAFRQVQAAVPDARLIIAGHGPMEAEVRAAVQRYGLRNVELRGKLPHRAMLALYDEADIYLNAPNMDCFPGSILEAFAAGIPVVTTNAGGIRHIVDHGRTGWLVEVGDAAGLARGALSLLADPERARTLAVAARRELERRYVWEAVGPCWGEMYRTLVAARGTR